VCDRDGIAHVCLTLFFFSFLSLWIEGSQWLSILFPFDCLGGHGQPIEHMSVSKSQLSAGGTIACDIEEGVGSPKPDIDLWSLTLAGVRLSISSFIA
jgi:hypothetical protein